MKNKVDVLEIQLSVDADIIVGVSVRRDYLHFDEAGDRYLPAPISSFVSDAELGAIQYFDNFKNRVHCYHNVLTS